MLSENGLQSGDNSSDTRPFVSVSDAAHSTQRTMRQVRNWIAEGKIRAERDERGDWWIHPDDVGVPQSTKGTSGGKRTVVAARPTQAGTLPGRGVHRAAATETDDPTLMMGFEVVMLRTELEQSRAELAAVRAELTSSEVLLADRTAQLIATRSALRAMVDVAADPAPRR